MLRALINKISLIRQSGRTRPSAQPVPDSNTLREAATRTSSQFSNASDAAVKAYSRRMMPPFSGQLQIAETRHARALSTDGRHWQIQIRNTSRANTQPRRPSRQAEQAEHFFAAATLTPNGLERQPLSPLIDSHGAAAAIDRLANWVRDSSLPFPAIDHHEYWLLDEVERKPLALLYSCIHQEESGPPSPRPVWAAMPASQLPIEDAPHPGKHYVPPANARLEGLIADRAGPSPRAAWFDRAEDTSDAFPPCLINEKWQLEDDHHLCQLYIRRMAPRLLTLQSLAHDNRQRLEQACRENALDVERFHAIYPEFIDQDLLTALRVEARLRRSAHGP